MGVHKLWTILEPSSKPVKLDSLNDQVLAVDASIWLYQFITALKHQKTKQSSGEFSLEENNTFINAHLLGFFRRICKLLHYGIKPIFIFDGEVCELKKNTIKERQQKKEGNRESSKAVARRLLAIQLLKNNLKKKNIKESKPNEKLLSNGNKQGAIKSNFASPTHKTSEWELPDQKEFNFERDDGRLATNDDYEEAINQAEDELQGIDLESVNPASEDFNNLPKSTQYMILYALRTKSRLRMGYSVDQLRAMFPDPNEFSRFQIDMVKRRNFFSQKLLDSTGLHGDSQVTKGKVSGTKKSYMLIKTDNGWAMSLDNNDGSSKALSIDISNDEVDRYSKVKDEEADNQNDEWEDVDLDILGKHKNQAPEDYSIKALINATKKRLKDHSPLGKLKSHIDIASGSPLKAEIISLNDDENQKASKFTHNNQYVVDLSSEIENEHNKDKIDKENIGDIQFLDDVQDKLHDDVNIEKKFLPTQDGNFGKRMHNLSEDEENSNLYDRKNKNTNKKQKVLNVDLFGTSQTHDDAVLLSDGSDADFEDIEISFPLKQGILNTDHYKTEKNVKPSNLLENNIFEIGINEREDTAQLSNLNDTDKYKKNDENYDEKIELTIPTIKEEEKYNKNNVSDHEKKDDNYANHDYSVKKYEQPAANVSTSSIYVDLSGNAENFAIRSQSKQKLNLHENNNSIVEKDSNEIELKKLNDEMEGSVFSSKASEAEGANLNKVDLSNSSIITESNNEAADIVSVDKSNEGSVAVSSELLPVSKEKLLKTKEQPDSNIKLDFVPATKGIFEDLDNPEINESKISYQTDDINDLINSNEHQLVEENNDFFAFDDNENVSNSDQKKIQQYEFFEDEEIELVDQISKEEADYNDLVQPLKNNSIPESKINQVFVDDGITEVTQQTPHNDILAYDQLITRYKKLQRDAEEVTPQMTAEVQELLQCFGIPYVTAPMEAEAQCAELMKLKLADGIITDDSDVFLFGGSKIYRKMFQEKQFVEFYDLESVNGTLGLTRDQLIEIAFLLGSDYTTGIKGIGPVAAIEILAHFGNLENFKFWYNNGMHNTKIIDSEKGFEKTLRKKLLSNNIMLSESWPYSAVKKEYNSPTVDGSDTPFKWGKPDLDQLRNLLRNYLGWHPEKSDEVLVPLIKEMNTKSKNIKQKKLTDFFSVDYSQNQFFGSSKRMAKAIQALKDSKNK
ncbi:hypothetical protein QEN19_004389 [Hanseniaspora menglaensis]